MKALYFLPLVLSACGGQPDHTVDVSANGTSIHCETFVDEFNRTSETFCNNGTSHEDVNITQNTASLPPGVATPPARSQP